jgi:hypothetical protein
MLWRTSIGSSRFVQRRATCPQSVLLFSADDKSAWPSKGAQNEGPNVTFLVNIFREVGYLFQNKIASILARWAWNESYNFVVVICMCWLGGWWVGTTSMQGEQERPLAQYAPYIARRDFIASITSNSDHPEGVAVGLWLWSGRGSNFGLCHFRVACKHN